SHFLRLPRELRDHIYTYVLVRDVIPVECAIAKIHESRTPIRSRSHRQNGVRPPSDQIHETYPLRASRTHRRLWTVPAFDINIPYDTGRVFDASSTILMTYQIAATNLEADYRVDLLKVCKQVYLEASEIFYSRNVFSFTSDFRIPCAFAFLCDRPAVSLRSIRSLELALIEVNNMRGTTPAHYPVVRRSTDCLVLQYAYQYFTELCTLLSTTRAQLRNLYLTVETLQGCNAIGPFDMASFLDREKVNTTMPEPWVPLWLEPLLKIRSLESVQICWISDQPHVRRVADTNEVVQRFL
ncbi:hypothetical protein EK21DRAFT_37592, partial [Setomelanomma holmii]